MIKKLISAICIAVMICAVPAQAKPPQFVPVEAENVEIRYMQGVPTASNQDERGGVLVTQGDPLYGRVRMRVAYTNGTGAPVNFGVENITATLDGVPVNVMTAESLQNIAKSKAAWATFAVAMAGGLGAVAANMNANRTYTTVGRTPFGFYSSRTTIHDPTAAALGTAASVGAATYGVAQINKNLEQTLSNLNDDVIQTTTLENGDGYGGMLVLDKFKMNKKSAGRLEITFKHNPADVEGYTVAFDMKKKK